jgi:hypothetical protein
MGDCFSKGLKPSLTGPSRNTLGIKPVEDTGCTGGVDAPLGSVELRVAALPTSPNRRVLDEFT